MKELIKSLTFQLRKDRSRKISFTMNGLKIYSSMNDNSRDLLIQILYKIRPSLGMKGLVIKLKHSDHLYLNKRTFYRCKNELIESGFLHKSGTDYFVDPNMVNYYTDGLMRNLSSLFGFKKVSSPTVFKGPQSK